MQGNPATGADVTGMLLFRQTTGECIRIFGELSVNDGTTQIEAESTDEIWRGLSIS